jgi:hypothetical protein
VGTNGCPQGTPAARPAPLPCLIQPESGAADLGRQFAGPADLSHRGPRLRPGQPPVHPSAPRSPRPAARMAAAHPPPLSSSTHVGAARSRSAGASGPVGRARCPETIIGRRRPAGRAGAAGVGYIRAVRSDVQIATMARVYRFDRLAALLPVRRGIGTTTGPGPTSLLPLGRPGTGGCRSAATAVGVIRFHGPFRTWCGSSLGVSPAGRPGRPGTWRSPAWAHASVVPTVALSSPGGRAACCGGHGAARPP